MIQVKCYSGYRINEQPRSFRLEDRQYRVEAVLDSWYGESSQYFKVQADDGNLYLLKYDNHQDQWDLVFYQDSRRMDILMPAHRRVKSPENPFHSIYGPRLSQPLH